MEANIRRTTSLVHAKTKKKLLQYPITTVSNREKKYGKDQLSLDLTGNNYYS